jgi:hypothetical protein
LLLGVGVVQPFVKLLELSNTADMTLLGVL